MQAKGLLPYLLTLHISEAHLPRPEGAVPILQYIISLSCISPTGILRRRDFPSASCETYAPSLSSQTYNSYLCCQEAKIVLGFLGIVAHKLGWAYTTKTLVLQSFLAQKLQQSSLENGWFQYMNAEAMITDGRPAQNMTGGKGQQHTLEMLLSNTRP